MSKKNEASFFIIFWLSGISGVRGRIFHSEYFFVYLMLIDILSNPLLKESIAYSSGDVSVHVSEFYKDCDSM